jgi:hypothetical protein
VVNDLVKIGIGSGITPGGNIDSCHCWFC